jgi:hypothetical protein
MRATEFIRNILDLIDNIDGEKEQVKDFEDEVCEPQSEEDTQSANSPDTLYADIKKVTVDAGGGVNGPKNPADLRVSTMPLYPNLQYKPGE